MDILLLILRLLLAGVFGVAGIAKAFDRMGTTKAFAEFGVPARLRKPLTYILPAFEIAVAIALLFTQISWYGAIGAGISLLVFISGMLYQFAKGNAPDCHCFGQIHSEPVGISSIVRNIVLLIPAGILSVQGPLAQGFSISNSPQEKVTLAVGIVLAAIGMFALLYLRTITEQQRRLIRTMEVMDLIDKQDSILEREEIGHPHEGLPFGALVPEFTGEDLDGNKVTLSDIRADGLPVLFMFVSPTCGPCKTLAPDIEQWEKEFAGRMKFVFVTELGVEENREKFAHIPGRTILLQDEHARTLSKVFRMQWTPMAVLMNAKGRIASFTAAGDGGIRELVTKVEEGNLADEYAFFKSRDTVTLGKIRIGEELKPISTQDINGRAVNSESFKGKQVLLTFWSPTCSYCLDMMEEMKAWEAAKNGDGPEMIVFADGDPDEHKKLGLKAPIVHDEWHVIGNAAGQQGTPSAVMIDEKGRFITETVAGSDEIWALIGGGPKMNG